MLEYLKRKLGVVVQGFRQGSLIIIVSCCSLEVLEALWKDYRRGHLNEVVQDTLVTAEVLKELNLSEVKLKTIISEARTSTSYTKTFSFKNQVIIRQDNNTTKQ